MTDEPILVSRYEAVSILKKNSVLGKESLNICHQLCFVY